MSAPLGSSTALVPVGVAAVLITFCLAGAQLYSSSAGSAALDAQLAETCDSDSALTLPIPPDEPLAEREVAAIGGDVPLVDPPRRAAIVRPFLETESALPRRLTLIWLDGIDRNVDPPLTPLAPGEIAMSANNLRELPTSLGSEVVLRDGVRLTVTQQFEDVPFMPIPEFWCGQPELLTPTAGGDLPPPYAIASLETIRKFGAQRSEFDEYHVVDDPLTLTDASQLEAGYAEAAQRWTISYPEAPVQVPRNELGRVVARARSVQTTVDRNLAPVLLTGLVAGGIVLVAAAVLVARDRRRDLRLLAVRGVPPWRIAAYVAPALSAAIVAGALAGAGLAWSTITAFGPSPELERGALVVSVMSVLVAVAAAIAVVSAVVAVVADGYAEATRRRLDVRLPAVMIVVAVVALAAIAFRRLDSNGGVRTFGVESRGGDLLAMGFPLFAMLAGTAAVGLVVAAVTPRLRLSGARLGRALRLGWRRVVLEASPLAAVVVSAALAAGCFTAANALASGAERQLHDKAEVYVGADLAVHVFDPVDVPDQWSRRTTVVSKVRGKWEGSGADIVGIDRSRFTDVARLRSDASPQSLEELVDTIAPTVPGSPLPAIAVGTGSTIGDVVSVTLPGNPDPVSIRIAATATFFPGKTSQIEMFVVDRPALHEVAPFSRSILLVRQPPPDALATIRDSGVRTGVVLDAETAFDGSAYSALRWAYAPLAALGALFAVVALALQLLVVAARREQRRIADAVMRRTGFTTRSLWWASVVETGVPLLAGSVVGMAAAVTAVSLAIGRLDPMPSLAPPARFDMPWEVLAATACVLPLWTAAIAFVIVRSTVGADPMRVFQGSA